MNPSTANEKILGTLRAFKAARIFNHLDRMEFRAVGMGASYGVIDQAVCVRDHEHVPPHPGCACGFYALRDRQEAVGLLCDVQAPALLDVELWGAFHEFERGFVAAVQAVRRVTLVPYCFPCLFAGEPRPRPACMLAPDTGVEGGDLVPVCDEHAADSDETIPVAQLAALLDIEVGFAVDEDQIVEALKERPRLARPKRPKPRPVRRLDDLLPGEVVHVFQNVIAQDPDGQLFINPLARLIQPLPGTDVPIRLNDDGEHEVLLDGLTDFTGWRPRHDRYRFALPLRTHGQLPEAEVPEDHEDAA